MEELRPDADAVRAAFGETADPSRHVPRPACEEVLARLEAFCRSARPTSPVAALVVPPGFGRTHLLRVLESRLAGSDAAMTPRASFPVAALAPSLEARASATPGGRRICAVYLPYAALSVPDLCRWVSGMLAGALEDVRPDPHATDDAIAVLARRAHALDTTLVLLIDDADSMPEETLRELATGLAGSSEGVGAALRIVLGLGDDSRAVRMLAALERLTPDELYYRAALDEPETEAYLRARMLGAGLDLAALDDLDATTVGRIRALSGGIPRRLHRVASALLEPERGMLARSLALHVRSQAWMGAPIGDGL